MYASRHVAEKKPSHIMRMALDSRWGEAISQSLRGYSTMVVQQPSKLRMRVRFPLPAPPSTSLVKDVLARMSGCKNCFRSANMQGYALLDSEMQSSYDNGAGMKGYSSVGRASVSKTEGRGFESCCPCHPLT